MTTQFPTMVYKCPGAHKCQGATYDYKAAMDDLQLKELTDSGWSTTLAKAIGRATATTGSGSAKPQAVKPVQAAEPEPVDKSAIIRAWLSGKLNDGGVDHDESMSEDELLFLFCQSFSAVAGDGGEELEAKADEAPPTREELEAKALELGVSFDGRTTDAALLRRIGAALELS